MTVNHLVAGSNPASGATSTLNPINSDFKLRKHQVSFEEAKEVFQDPMHISKLDHRVDF